MELNVSEPDQRKIEREGEAAEAALVKYLATKYGGVARDAKILVNEAELNPFVHEGSGIKQAEVESYTGYFLAKVLFGGQEVDVRYSPTGSTALYSLGGADNRQSEVLQEDLRKAISDALPESASVTIRAGSPFALGGWLLDEPYDGKDWFSPVPPDGFCYVEVSVPRGTAELTDIGDALSSFFSFHDTKGVYVCADVRDAEASSAFSGPSFLSQGNTPEGQSLTWENSTWDPSFAERRLTGGLA